MARIDTIKIPDKVVPQNDVGAYGISADFSISATQADNGDRITLFEFARAGVLLMGGMAVSATLGASCTIKLQHSNAADDTHTDLTAATTAGGADREALTRAIRVAEGDTISLLVGGADIAAAATVSIDLLASHNPVVQAAAY